jgi:hypothetical protein
VPGSIAAAVSTKVPQITNKNAASTAFKVNAPVQFEGQLMIASFDAV